MEDSGIGRNDQSQVVIRPLAYHHPDLWGDRFVNYTPPLQDTQFQMEEELNKLKEEVRKKLLTIVDDPKERITDIDAVERLGVAYYFEEEIEAILQQIYDNYGVPDDIYENDLHYISLRFRILRQHGFMVSCDVFGKFKGEDGSFKESITRDVEGMLNLYEASCLSVHGEKILDEAEEFTSSQLKSLIGKLSEPLATQVSRALKLPQHRGMMRLFSRYYMETYEGNPCHDKNLLRFAKIDFNLLQFLHLKELRDLSRWWKGLDVFTKLPFLRDRIVETYFWAIGTDYQPQYALGRVINTKLWKMISIMDDIYDSYGLFEELKLYTEAVQRWDKSCMSQLPDYIKLAYENLLDTFHEFEQDLEKEERSHLVSYVREQMKDLSKGYMKEAKLLHEKYIPTHEEFLEDIGIATAGSALLFSGAFLGMGKVANEEAFVLLTNATKLIKTSGVIIRILNDIASRKIEQKRTHVATTIDCFMAQYGVSEEKAIAQLYKKVKEARKDFNEEMFRLTKFPRPLLTLILNVTRYIEVLYHIGVDEYANVTQNMRDQIQLLFIDHVTL